MSYLPITIDTQYLFPKFAAAYLVTEPDRAFFIENNTTRSIPTLLQTLHRSGFRNEQVEYVIVTHVHLDHAGGTSALMKACPHAVLLAHPRAAPHMIDPSRLVQSARQVYGDQEFEKLYGQIDPVDPKRVRVVETEKPSSLGPELSVSCILEVMQTIIFVF